MAKERFLFDACYHLADFDSLYKGKTLCQFHLPQPGIRMSSQLMNT